MSQILIIGAGLSGLSAAHRLKQQGHQVTLVDKGRGIGGRMATRRFDGATFDHGAQFFTVRSAEFRAELQRWIEAGVAREWFEGYPSPTENKPDDHYPRYCGTKGMTGIAKFLGQGLDVHLSEEIDSLTRENGVWRTTSQSGNVFTGEKLILTAPIPQSLTLFDRSGESLPDDVRKTLQSREYEPCFAVLCVLDGPSAIPAPGLFYINGEPISWISDNFQKGVSAIEGSITIHSSATFAHEHYEDDQNEVAKLLIEAAKDWLGSPVKSFQVRRWRYSKPENPIEVGALYVPELGVAFAGDALGGAKVEGAFLSGIKAAELISAR